MHMLSFRFGRSSDKDGDLELNTWGYSIGPETFRLSYFKVNADPVLFTAF